MICVKGDRVVRRDQVQPLAVSNWAPHALLFASFPLLSKLRLDKNMFFSLGVMTPKWVTVSQLWGRGKSGETEWSPNMPSHAVEVALVAFLERYRLCQAMHLEEGVTPLLCKIVKILVFLNNR